VWLALWQIKLCDPTLTHAILGALEVCSHEKALHKRPCLQLLLELSPRCPSWFSRSHSYFSRSEELFSATLCTTVMHNNMHTKITYLHDDDLHLRFCSSSV